MANIGKKARKSGKGHRRGGVKRRIRQLAKTVKGENVEMATSTSGKDDASATVMIKSYGERRHGIENEENSVENQQHQSKKTKTSVINIESGNGSSNGIIISIRRAS